MTYLACTLAFAVLVKFNEYRGWAAMEKYLAGEMN